MYVCMCVRISMYVCIHIGMNVSIYVCIYVYICNECLYIRRKYSIINTENSFSSLFQHYDN